MSSKISILDFLNSCKRKIISKQNLKETKKKSIKRNSDLKPASLVVGAIENELEKTNLNEMNMFHRQNMEVDKNEALEKHSQLLQEEILIKPNAKVKASHNVRALPMHAETYELERFKMKTLLIFNQIEINDFEPRHGTERDVEALEKTFRSFGFEVTEYKDLMKHEIMDRLKIFFDQDFTDYGCIGIVVLSHGSKYGDLWAKDQKYNEMEIITYFNVHNKPTLITKPKFLIIQACRGTKVFPGAPVYANIYDSGILSRKEIVSSFEPYHLPIEADVLILHSSYISSPSYRDGRDGSWCIQSLCERINQLAATHDMENIITAVKRDVAINKELHNYNPTTMEMQVNKQMPVMTSSLIRKLYLKKFEEVPILLVSDYDETHL